MGTLSNAVHEAVKEAGEFSLEDAILASVGQKKYKRDNRDEDGQRELTFEESMKNYYAEQTKIDQKAVDFVNSDKVALTLSPTMKDRLMQKAMDGASLTEVEGLYQQMYAVEMANKNAMNHKSSEIDLDFNR